MPKRHVLLMAADRRLNGSLAELLRTTGLEVIATAPAPGAPQTSPPIDAVVAACDSWPWPWTLPMLRTHFRSVPCLLLSGSPVSGPYAATGFRKGYFMGLPADGRRIAAQVTSIIQ